jgi:Ser/Thr protein kinase RdoA (MazF antagonist)
MMNKPLLTSKDIRFEPPSFSIKDLLEVVKDAYGLSGTLKPLAGERDQNHMLQTHGKGKYLVKVAGANEDRSVVDYQIKTLHHIEQKSPQLNIPRNLKTLTGEDFVLIRDEVGKEHLLRLLTFLDGVPFGDDYEPSLETLYDAGRFQGQMCAALIDFSHPSEGYFMPWDISQGLVLSPSLHVSQYGDVERLVLPLLDHFEAEILPHMNRLRKQTIHNDAHEGNILKSAPGKDDFCGVIDFGDIVYAPVVQDLSIPMTRFVGLASDPIASGKAYVKGFCSAFPLLSDELDMLYDLILIRSCLTVQLIDFRIANNDVNKDDLIEEYPSLVSMLENLISLDRHKITAAFHQARLEGTHV